MHRSLLVLSLSLALTIGPIGLQSSLGYGITQENIQSQKAGSPQVVENSDSLESSSPESVPEKAQPERATTPGAKGARRTGARKPRRALASRLTQVQMRNVDFHVDDTIVLHVRNLRGALLRTNNANPAFFDDKNSFNIRIDSGTIAISTESLASLMNNFVFAYPKAPLKEVSLSTEGNQIKMKGTVHKVTDLPFEIVGDLSATPEGKIQLHPTSIKTGGLPVKGLMNLFGIELEELIKGTESRGVRIDDNDIIMDPEVMIPPPQIRGKISAIRIEGNEVVQIFGPENKSASAGYTASHRRGSNFMHYLGGTIRFGKLTMTNADLKLVDQDPKDPFDFSLTHYNSQLVAGYSKNKPNLGLVVYVPDYSRLRGTASNAIPANATANTVSKR